jgi:hypothetical protein
MMSSYFIAVCYRRAPPIASAGRCDTAATHSPAWLCASAMLRGLPSEHHLMRREHMPALGMSLFLLAAGLVLAFAINATVAGVDIVVIGLIMAGVGLFGVLLSMMFMMSLMPWGAERTTVVDERPHEPRVH